MSRCQPRLGQNKGMENVISAYGRPLKSFSRFSTTWWITFSSSAARKVTWVFSFFSLTVNTSHRSLLHWNLYRELQPAWRPKWIHDRCLWGHNPGMGKSKVTSCFFKPKDCPVPKKKWRCAVNHCKAFICATRNTIHYNSLLQILVIIHLNRDSASAGQVMSPGTLQ